MKTITKYFFFLAAMILAASCEKSERGNGIPDNPSENTLSLKQTTASLEYLQVMLLKDVAPAGAVWSVVEGNDEIVSVFNDTLVARGKGTAKVMAQLGEEKGVMMVTVGSDEYVPVRTLTLEVNGKRVVTLSVDSLKHVIYNEEVINNTFEVFQSEAVKEVKVVGYEPANATCPAIEEVYFIGGLEESRHGETEEGWRYELAGDTTTGANNRKFYAFEGSLSDLSGKIGSGGSVKFANSNDGIRMGVSSTRFPHGYEGVGLGFKMQILPDVLLVGDRRSGRERALEYRLTDCPVKDLLFSCAEEGIPNVVEGGKVCQGRLKWLWFERPNSVEVVTNNEYEENGKTYGNIVIRPGETIQLQFKAQAPPEFIETAEWGLGGQIVLTNDGVTRQEDCADDSEFRPKEGSRKWYAEQFLSLTRDGKLTCSPDIDLNYFDPLAGVDGITRLPKRIQDDKELMLVTVFLMPSCKKGPYEREYNLWTHETGPSTLKATAFVQVIPW